jgi:glutaredoxin 3
MFVNSATLYSPPYEEIIDTPERFAPLVSLNELIAYTEEKVYTQERPHLVLYYRPSCPYCKKIENYLRKEKKWDSIEKKNIQNQKALDELIKKGGKRQVPCLMINDKPLYESNDILNWLKANKDKY